MPPRILFVSGFHPKTRARDLAFEFERFGPLVRCDVPAPRGGRAQANPYAFVEFRSSRDAESAYYDMHGRQFEGHRLSLQWAKNPPSSVWRYDRSPPRRSGRDRRSRSPRRRRSRSRDHGADEEKRTSRKSRSRDRDDKDKDRDDRDGGRKRGRSRSRSGDRGDRDRGRERSRSVDRERDVRKRSPSGDRDRDRSRERERESDRDRDHVEVKKDSEERDGGAMTVDEDRNPDEQRAESPRD